MDIQFGVRVANSAPAYLRRAFGDFMRIDHSADTSHERAVRRAMNSAGEAAWARPELRPTLRRMREAIYRAVEGVPGGIYPDGL